MKIEMYVNPETEDWYFSIGQTRSGQYSEFNAILCLVHKEYRIGKRVKRSRFVK